jgi:hypothetical protein
MSRMPGVATRLACTSLTQDKFVMKTVIQLLLLVSCLCAFMTSGSARAAVTGPGAGASFKTHGATEANVHMEGFGETDANGDFITEGDCWIRPKGGEWQKDGKWRKNGKNLETFVPGATPDPVYTYEGAAVSANTTGDVTCHTDPAYNSTWTRG